MPSNHFAPLKEKELKKLTKKELIALVLELQKQQESNLNKARNSRTNRPSSKMPEWDKGGNPKEKSDQGKSRKKKKRKKRIGCGNKSKSAVVPDATNMNTLDACPTCSHNLKNKAGRKNRSRIIEDIAPSAEKTIVTKEVTESKWCPNCKKTVSSKTEKALPGSDIGLNASIEIAYLWVMCSLSLPNIASFFHSFKSCVISTAGISKMMIRLAEVLQPVYQEILGDIKEGSIIWADETGWRVNGKLWWLWAFANKRSAYYWPDPKRTGQVALNIIGPIFHGLLTVDGWGAYNKIFCDKQTCMPHIYRKIRAFIEDFPQYRSLLSFYLKLRQVVRDGEALQEKRSKIKEETFQKNLNKLNERLETLLDWKQPNEVLQKVIKKVRRQQGNILTFVSHENAESHNNYGEYIIKKGVLKRKISGGSKSEKGFRAYANMQSIAMTCKLRNISFTSFMRKTLSCFIRTGKPMLLSEYEAYLLSQSKAA